MLLPLALEPLGTRALLYCVVAFLSIFPNGISIRPRLCHKSGRAPSDLSLRDIPFPASGFCQLHPLSRPVTVCKGPKGGGGGGGGSFNDQLRTAFRVQ